MTGRSHEDNIREYHSARRALEHAEAEYILSHAGIDPTIRRANFIAGHKEQIDRVAELAAEVDIARNASDRASLAAMQEIATVWRESWALQKEAR